MVVTASDRYLDNKWAIRPDGLLAVIIIRTKKSRKLGLPSKTTFTSKFELQDGRHVAVIKFHINRKIYALNPENYKVATNGNKRADAIMTSKDKMVTKSSKFVQSLFSTHNLFTWLVDVDREHD
jgi:hypothetical protein